MIEKLKSSSPTENIKEDLQYASAGVDTVAEEKGLDNLINWIKRTIAFSDCQAKLDFGYFANILDIGNNVGLAISTDGVGTKIIVAQMMNRYDTIGIDCIAMNVNDILCVGAKPISMVDYIAVQNPDPHLLEEIGKGLYNGARIANISIPGGEIAQIKEMLRGEKEGFGFDLVGTAVGLVSLDRIIIGKDIKEGDILLGLRSNGIHSNGLTLARKVFFEKGKYKIDKYIEEFGTTIGEELLKPTHIYVPEVVEMMKSGLNIKALIHITSDGFLNLLRVKADCGYVIENLPEPQPIFRLIQEVGEISDEEMFRVYNMGIGFCVISSTSEVEKVFDISKRFNVECHRMGYCTGDRKRKVIIESKKLIGKDDKFLKF
jgi:phosphoribosylformylglycinamidine cyclo-ligase